MKLLTLILVGFCSLFFAVNAGAIDKSDILGTWKSTDTQTGKIETIIFGETHFGDGKKMKLPYLSKSKGDLLEIYIGNGNNPPATLKLTDENNGEVQLPNGRKMSLQRISNDTGSLTTNAVEKPGKVTATNPLAGMYPNGVPTPFEPMKQSMEMLLSSGWELRQVSGAQNSMTALLVKGGSNALCILIPLSMSKGSTAISDCRKLN